MSDAPAPSSIPFASGFLAEVMPGSQALGSVAYWLALLLVTAGVILIAVVCMAWLKNRARVEVVPPKVAGRPPAAAPLAGPAEASPTIEEAQNLLRLMGEAEDVCRRLGSELDAKAERVERLLARVEGMLREEARIEARPAPGQRVALSPAAPTSRLAPTPAAPEVPDEPAETPRPEIVTRPVPIPAAPVPAPGAQRVTPPPAQPAAAAGLSTDQLSERIFELADGGMAPAEIAQRLGQHVGKVELILALRAV